MFSALFNLKRAASNISSICESYQPLDALFLCDPSKVKNDVIFVIRFCFRRFQFILIEVNGLPRF